MTYNKIMTDAHIQIDINMGYYSSSKLRKGDVEGYAKDMKREADDIKEFLRDHRSLDIHDVYVVPEYEYQCPFCKNVFAADALFPECCEEAIRKWATMEQLVELGFEE